MPISQILCISAVNAFLDLLVISGKGGLENWRNHALFFLAAATYPKFPPVVPGSQKSALLGDQSAVDLSCFVGLKLGSSVFVFFVF